MIQFFLKQVKDIWPLYPSTENLTSLHTQGCKEPRMEKENLSQIHFELPATTRKNKIGISKI